MFHARHFVSALSLTLSALALACGGTEPGDPLATSEDGLHVASCNLRDLASCDRGESCLSVTDTDAYCTTGRCNSIEDCRDGYVCRAAHCLRLERDPGDVCPRGARLDRPTCRRDQDVIQVSRAPACFACEDINQSRPDRPEDRPEDRPADRPEDRPADRPEDRPADRPEDRPVDRCDIAASPTARGQCRSILGFFWDGRVCVGLGGCEIVDADGLFRSARECEATYSHCSTPTRPGDGR